MNRQILTWQKSLRDAALPEKVAVLSHFFKTGKGEYGEGDVFIGLTVPENRKISETYFALPLSDIEVMLESPIHEFRFAALLAMVKKYQKAKGDETLREEIVDFYLRHTQYINNWDLVDLSCYHILGDFQMRHPERDLLRRLSDSHLLWEQRMAIVSTMVMVRKGDFGLTKEFAVKFLGHKHDLMQKATGWLLREMGKKNVDELLAFLDEYALRMSRTTLRYAIERIPEAQRQHYLSLK